MGTKTNIPKDVERPFEAYEGDKPYIFVSYAHKDAELVFPEIKRFHDAGYPIWYDDALTLGEEWDEKIAISLMKSSLMVVFITENSMASSNVLDEIRMALRRKIDVAPIYLEDAELPPALELRLSTKHAIFKFLATDKDYIKECFKAFDHSGIPQLEFEDVKKVEIRQVREVRDVSYHPPVRLFAPNSKLINIKPQVHEFFDGLSLHDDEYNGHYYRDYLMACVDMYMDNPNSYNAFELYRMFFMVYQLSPADGLGPSYDGSNRILDLIKVMKKHGLDKDIFPHCANVFLLGLSIYSQNSQYRSLFQEYVLDSGYRKYYADVNGVMSDEEFLYRWGITSLFHNLTFPLEESLPRVQNACFADLKSVLNIDGDISRFSDFDCTPNGEFAFADGYGKSNSNGEFLERYRPTNVLANKIAADFDLDYGEVVRNLKDLPNHMSDDFIDVGYFSSILLLNAYAGLNLEYGKSPEFFFYPIADSAAAILLNSYYENVLQAQPFNLNALNCECSPLTYLLFLTRKLLEIKSGDVEADITEDKLDIRYRVRLLFSGEDVHDIQNRISEILDVGEIFSRGLSIQMSETGRLTEDSLVNVPARNLEFRDSQLSIVERLAIQVHQNTIDDGFTRDSYGDLPIELKLSCINRARSIFAEINEIDCGIVLWNNLKEEYRLSDEEIMVLAKKEHENWCELKISQGWKWGSERDNSKLTHPLIISWDNLSPEMHQINIDIVRDIIQLIDSSGLKIVREDAH